jgi:phosphoglucomutase
MKQKFARRRLIPIKSREHLGYERKLRFFGSPTIWKISCSRFLMSWATWAEKTLVLGGDGRYYNREAAQTIIKMASMTNKTIRLVATTAIIISWVATVSAWLTVA